MAIGQPETERWFEKVLPKAAKGLAIQFRRVDRVEHNDNIDTKILELIKESDLTIADLTFARPSVYFEAGYAQRVGPVIYTCRADHFKSRDDDVYQNFQVHFDLKMRNIIPWKSLTDAAFPAKLNKRIVHVIRPILAVRQAEEQAGLEAARFGALSEMAKYVALRETARSLLARRLHYPVPRYQRDEPVLAWYRRRETLHVVALWGLAHATPSDVRLTANLHFDIILNSEVSDLLAEKPTIRDVRCWLLMYSPNPLSDSMLRKSWLHSVPLANGGIEVTRSHIRQRNIPIREEVHVLSRVRSEGDLTRRLSAILKETGFIA
ncbi:MAG TPA: hypothetical protein VH040_14905 [Usitatibacter sp.]|nr:hypothetical protein [Usitatibacter sp.]